MPARTYRRGRESALVRLDVPTKQYIQARVPASGNDTYGVGAPGCAHQTAHPGARGAYRGHEAALVEIPHPQGAVLRAGEEVAHVPGDFVGAAAVDGRRGGGDGVDRLGVADEGAGGGHVFAREGEGEGTEHAWRGWGAWR